MVARVFGSLARTAKGMAEGAARAWVQGRVSGGQTIVIPDVTPGIPLANQFASASSDRTFVEVKAGTHQLAVRMNDNLIVPGFNFVQEEEITLAPRQVMVVDFNPDQGGLYFK